MDKEQILRTIYYNPSHPAGFSSAIKLHKAAKEFIADLNINDVEKWLSGEFTYTLHKPVRRKFQRNPIIVEHIDQQWEADLVEMIEFNKVNKGFKYILNVIDVMSKHAWAVALKNKKMETIIKAFESIFEKGRVPVFIRTDRGKEFLNRQFKKFLKENGIHHFTSKNQTVKCAIVERFNRTLKEKMFKYFTARGTRVWYDILEELVSAYNNTKHRTIKMTPIEASNTDSEILFRNIYGVKSIEEINKNPEKRQLEIGDTVRKVYKQGKFDKGFYPNWTDQTYKVETITNEPVKDMYNIQNEQENRELQRFYPEEIQKIQENLYRVEKIIKFRKKNGKKEFLVKWLNYPETYNSWIDEHNLVYLNQ